MQSRRLFGAALPLALAGIFTPAALTATPPGPPARSQVLFEWSGTVDKEIRIEMRGDRAVISRIGERERAGGRVRTRDDLPRSSAYVTVERLQGRGRVDIVQQPSRQNGYTAIFRIRDTQSGASNYRIRAYTTASQWDDRNNGNNGRGRGNGKDDDRWDDRRDRDDRGRDDRNRDDRSDRDRRDAEHPRDVIPNWPW